MGYRMKKSYATLVNNTFKNMRIKFEINRTNRFGDIWYTTLENVVSRKTQKKKNRMIATCCDIRASFKTYNSAILGNFCVYHHLNYS